MWLSCAIQPQSPARIKAPQGAEFSLSFLLVFSQFSYGFKQRENERKQLENEEKTKDERKQRENEEKTKRKQKKNPRKPWRKRETRGKENHVLNFKPRPHARPLLLVSRLSLSHALSLLSCIVKFVMLSGREFPGTLLQLCSPCRMSLSFFSLLEKSMGMEKSQKFKVPGPCFGRRSTVL